MDDLERLFPHCTINMDNDTRLKLIQDERRFKEFQLISETIYNYRPQAPQLLSCTLTQHPTISFTARFEWTSDVQQAWHRHLAPIPGWFHRYTESWDLDVLCISITEYI